MCFLISRFLNSIVAYHSFLSEPEPYFEAPDTASPIMIAPALIQILYYNTPTKCNIFHEPVIRHDRIRKPAAGTGFAY